VLHSRPPRLASRPDDRTALRMKYRDAARAAPEPCQPRVAELPNAISDAPSGLHRRSMTVSASSPKSETSASEESPTRRPGVRPPPCSQSATLSTPFHEFANVFSTGHSLTVVVLCKNRARLVSGGPIYEPVYLASAGAE
jgi:hypothetical protein